MAQSIHWKKMDFENINKENGEEKPHLNLVKLQMESMNKRQKIHVLKLRGVI